MRLPSSELLAATCKRWFEAYTLLVRNCVARTFSSREPYSPEVRPIKVVGPKPCVANTKLACTALALEIISIYLSFLPDAFHL